MSQKQCKGDLDWYIEIKEIQGDVEVTSVNQVEDINNHGSYTISCKGKNIMQSIGDAITLKILRVKAAKKQYSFNDLRDLESKLVLIRGRNTKGGAEIDRFLNVSIFFSYTIHGTQYNNSRPVYEYLFISCLFFCCFF